MPGLRMSMVLALLGCWPARTRLHWEKTIIGVWCGPMTFRDPSPFHRTRAFCSPLGSSESSASSILKIRDFCETRIYIPDSNSYPTIDRTEFLSLILVCAVCLLGKPEYVGSTTKKKRMYFYAVYKTLDRVEPCTELHEYINWSGGINATVYRKKCRQEFVTYPTRRILIWGHWRPSHR